MAIVNERVSNVLNHDNIDISKVIIGWVRNV